MIIVSMLIIILACLLGLWAIECESPITALLCLLAIVGSLIYLANSDPGCGGPCEVQEVRDGSEADLQNQVADYLRLRYPQVLFHSDFGSGKKVKVLVPKGFAFASPWARPMPAQIEIMDGEDER